MRVSRLLTAAVALALVLGAVGLFQDSAQAQDVEPLYVCSNDSAGCTIVKFGDHDADGTGTGTSAHVYYEGTASATNSPTPIPTPAAANFNNVFTFNHNAGGNIVVHNLDLPRNVHKVNPDLTELGPDQECGTGAGQVVCVDGANANPKAMSFTANIPITFVAVHRSAGLTDTLLVRQVKAFNGNRIQVSYTPGTGSTFATIKTVLVDNGKPTLVSTSPEPGLIVKGGVDITFSAEITDNGSGFAGKFGNFAGPNDTPPASGLAASLYSQGLLTANSNDKTIKGGIRLVVAGNVVGLVEDDFTKIDGGWRVSKTLNSTALQTIATNVPWYFEVRDRANNMQRSSGAVSGTVGAGSTEGTIIDDKFKGRLNPSTFLGSTIQVMKTDGAITVTSNNRDATALTPSTGTFAAIVNSVDDPLFDDGVDDRRYDSDGDGDVDTDDTVIPATAGYQCRFDPRDEIKLGPITGTSTTAAPQTLSVTPKGANDDNTGTPTQIVACNPAPKDKYEILGTNLITIDSVRPELISGSPVVTGVGYNATTKKEKAQRNSIKVTFTDQGKATGVGSDAPGSGIDGSTVTKDAFTVSGHTVDAVLSVGNKVFLTLAEDLGSTEQPTVDIAGATIMDKAGNALAAVRQKAADGLGPVLSLSESADLSNDEVTLTITTDEQLTAAPTVYVTPADKDGNALVETNDDGEITANAVAPVVQTGALTYTYTHKIASYRMGRFSVYVEAQDVGQTKSTTGNKKSAVESNSFTFQLDNEFNGGDLPKVTVSNADNEAEDQAKTLSNKLDGDVEQISPMIITVDYSREAGEYDRDGYKTVTLTEATLKITFADGDSESRTFDLATDVSSPDSIKYTIPLLNPKIGIYALTVKGEDAAGNTSPASGQTVTWKVTEAQPVEITLQPGWNLISLPFQPANPAINSVIPADHPITLVMTLDSAEGTWLFSRRDAETGMFTGDIGAITASTAYFVNTDSFESLELLRPAIATAAAAPSQPPHIEVKKGWNLVPVSTNQRIVGIDADRYFRTLGDTWLQAMAWNSLTRTWVIISPNALDTHLQGGQNRLEPRIATDADDRTVEIAIDRCGRKHQGKLLPHDTPKPLSGDTIARETVTVGAQVCVGQGMWLWVTEDGTLIPG